MSQFVEEDRAATTFRVNRQVFTSAEILELERQLIFDKTWIFVGHASEIPAPNSFLLRRVAGRPVIFVRDSSGQLQVLLNACRHRGAEVCRVPSGEAKTFTCFYHGWAYRNNGDLVHLPDAGAYGPGFDRSRMGLDKPPRVDEYRGFVFANFDPDAGRLEDYLADSRYLLDLIADQSETGMRVVPGVHSYWMNANWKLLMENSVDGYHAATVHQTYFEMMMNLGVRPGLAPPQDPNAPKTRGAGIDLRHGHATTMSWPGRAGALALLTDDHAKQMYAARQADLARRFDLRQVEKIVNTARNTLYFPNFVTVDLTFGIQLRTMWPTAPDTTEITGWLITDPELDEELQEARLDNALTFWGPGGLATPDDVEALEQCQRGFAVRRESPWSNLSKGLGRDVPDMSDELPQRAFWREWNRRICGEKLPYEGTPYPEVAALPVYASAGAS
jgi:p-cumate 2,3-dioxygenase alpha subunit